MTTAPASMPQDAQEEEGDEWLMQQPSQASAQPCERVLVVSAHAHTSYHGGMVWWYHTIHTYHWCGGGLLVPHHMVWWYHARTYGSWWYHHTVHLPHRYHTYIICRI